MPPTTLNSEEPLSLRPSGYCKARCRAVFPFLFGGAFIEASSQREPDPPREGFPCLFGGAFIEAG